MTIPFPIKMLTCLFASLFWAQSAAAQLANPDDPLALHLLEVRDGKSSKLMSDALPDGPVIIHLWATWCGPCREELPEVEEFAKLLDEKGASDRFMVVSVDSIEFDDVENFLRERLGLQDLKTLQTAPELAPAVFPIRGYPVTFMLNDARQILRKQDGPIAWARPNIRKLLLGHLQVTP